MPTLSDLPIRIRAKIQPNADNGCWEWIGWLDRYGYGRSGKKFKHCLICYNDWRRKWRARQRQ